MFVDVDFDPSFSQTCFVFALHLLLQLLGETDLLSERSQPAVAAYKRAVQLRDNDMQIATGLTDAYIANGQQVQLGSLWVLVIIGLHLGCAWVADFIGSIGSIGSIVGAEVISEDLHTIGKQTRSVYCCCLL